MIPILTPTPRSDRRIADRVGVSRSFAVPADHLPAALSGLGAGTTVPAGPAGRLVLATPFEPASTPGRWRARARLHPGGARLVPHARVELELSPWSDTAGDLHLRPVARRPHAWGTRRLRRYVTVAPLAAEEVVRRIETAWRTARTATPLLARQDGAAVAPQASVERPRAA